MEYMAGGSLQEKISPAGGRPLHQGGINYPRHH